MTKSMFVAALIAATTAAPVARAQDAAAKADRQCLAVSLIVAGDKKEDISKIGMLASYYFLGRLGARSPETLAPEALGPYLRNLSDEQLDGQADRCVSEFQHAADVFKDLDDRPASAGAK